MIEIYILGKITFSLIKTEDIFKILKIYQYCFIWYAIWSFIGFMVTGRGIVYWDYILNEEDAVGPLMCIGLGFSYQFVKANEKACMKNLGILASILCVLGVIISLARGSFLVLITTIMHIWVRNKNKMRGVIIIGACAVIVIIGSSIFFPNNAYWNEMKTINEGTKEGTGRDRKVLWSIALIEFYDNPIIGVGPNNFGIAAVEYIKNAKDVGSYIDPNKIWGRALHNSYFQLLSELGLIGFIIYLLILYDFFKTNFRMRRQLKGSTVFEEVKKHYYILVALEIGAVAYLLNAFFYDITYYQWLWEILLLNKLYEYRIEEDYEFKPK